MNMTAKKLLSLILFVIMVFSLTACAPEAPEHLALVMLHHSNAPVPDVGHAREAITRICEQGGSLHIIEGDGEPYLFASYQIEAPEGGISANTRRKEVEKKLSKLLAATEGCLPRTQQADPLGALELGGRALTSVDAGQKQIIVIGSGLSDSWPLDMSSQQVCVAQLDPQTVVQTLEEAGAIPRNLQGYQITWYGIGETCPPQEELGPRDVENLKAVWRAILETAGAQITFPENLSASMKPTQGLPAVNTVAVQSRENERLALPEEILILEGSVAFGGDSAKLKNLDQVDQVLSPLVEVLKSNPEARLALFGGTARAGTAEGCRQFGQQRADAVRDYLLKQGVSAEQVLAVGIGWDHHLHEPDLRGDGSLDERVAPRNRVVYIVDAESPDAQLLLAQYG